MQKTISLLLSVFLFLSAYSAKQTATFIYEEQTDSFPKMHEYNSLKVTVNNVQIKIKNKPYKINLNPLIDTIKIEGVYWTKKVLTVLAKFKMGEKYRLVPNICGFFEIRPSNDSTGRQDFIRTILTNNENSPLFFEGDICCQETDGAIAKDTTLYYDVMHSGYCLFASSSFYVCTKNVDLEGAQDSSICEKILIQFFSDEMFSILYDCKTKRMNVKFDGYYDKTKKILIKEY